MRVAKEVVVVLLAVVAGLIGIWGGGLAVSGISGDGTEDIAPVFFIVFGGVLLVLAGALAWAAVVLHRGDGVGSWPLVMVTVLTLGVAVAAITGFWLGVYVLAGLMGVGMVLKAL